VLQQTPSAQWPLLHGVPDTHALPVAIEQVPGCDGSLQTPPVGHFDDAQQTPSTQLPETHAFGPLHVVPCARRATQCFVASQ
jgi:hypothetical protein